MFLRKWFKNKIFDMQLHGLGLSYTKKISTNEGLESLMCNSML